MAKAALDSEEEKPLDPAAERVRRKLVRFMAINLSILFVAVMVVVAALVYRSMSTPSAPALPPSDMPGGVAQGRIVLPADARVVSQSVSGDRISVQAALADGKQAIFVYDMTGGRVIARIDIGAE